MAIFLWASFYHSRRHPGLNLGVSRATQISPVILVGVFYTLTGMILGFIPGLKETGKTLIVR